MLSALAELLEEKGVLAEEEWKKKIESKIKKGKRLLKYREMQFRS